MGLAAFAAMASMRWCDAMLPALSTEFAVTPGQAAQVVAAFALSYGVMQLVYGPLGDRLGKQRLVSLAALACTLGSVASALAPSLGWLTLARALSGATAAGVVPMTMAWIGDRVPYEHRQAVLARLLGATVTGMIAGQWLGGVFADTVGWRFGFAAVAVVFGISGLALQWSLRQLAASAHEQHDPNGASFSRKVLDVLANADARRLMWVAGIEGALAFSAVAFIPSHLHAKFGLSMSVAGGIVALYGVGGLVYSRSAVWLLARMGQLPMARTGGFLMGSCWVLLAWWPDWRVAPLLCGVGGLGFYMLHNVLQTHATQVVPAVRGTAVSLFACALFLGQSLGVSLFSWVVDRWSAAVALSICGPGLMLLGVYFAARTSHPNAASPVPTPQSGGNLPPR